MRENRTYGSEGGAAETNRPFLPLSRAKGSIRVHRNVLQSDQASLNIGLPEPRRLRVGRLTPFRASTIPGEGRCSKGGEATGERNNHGR